MYFENSPKFHHQQVIFVLVIGSTIAQPILPGVVDNDDLISAEADLLRFFIRFLLGGSRSEETINPLQLIQLGTSFLRTIGNLENLGNNELNVRSDSVQDPRVLNFGREINQRNQLSGLLRLFSGFLGRR